ncbi:hypothetical protein CLOSTASPAR_03406 [[Clostridium] asparagiforme DSM 15981]|uniref:Uncharacterized protein n=1 Tax=[Clostridium] asparagiforme DSM 15981 TaxID=518636 RepID=C0D2B7_9FIRM|nr:hypothetical protein CLOSTASPAR_03406 [[Clostridium] asparagiforme DSM 15981]
MRQAVGEVKRRGAERYVKSSAPPIPPRIIRISCAIDILT